ncbi:MAG: S41 family peptidase [Bryobacteraceae bacterium]
MIEVCTPKPRFTSAAFFCACIALLVSSLGAQLNAQTRLLRYPDLHGGKVVFTYAGDLWTASVEGGIAARITAHPGIELFAKFSPDGNWIAFTGQYDGDEQLYVVPSTGGVPRQLTFYPAKGPLPPRWGYDNQVYGWTPDGKSVLFRSMRDSWANPLTHLFTVAVEGGLPVRLPMPVSGGGDLSPDGRRVVYSPLTRDFRTWKRYQGGWAQDLYTFDLESYQVEPVAHHPRSERDPMWIGGKIYFSSDRTGTLNLFEFDPSSGKVRALTEYTDWDVRWPSKGDAGQIVYELNGELHVMEAKRGSRSRRISINVPNDGLASRPSQVNVGTQVQEFELSPKGERALFVARGDVFTAPIEKGVSRNLTRSTGAHDKAAVWSPDGRHVAFLSDRSGEEEIYLAQQDGNGEPQQLTTGGKAMRYRLRWSPDSRNIAFSDKDGKLYVLKVEDKSIIEVADEKRGQMANYSWSPDSGWLAYSMSEPNNFEALYIWGAGDNKSHRVTTGLWNEEDPAWDPDGRYLYFFSDRDYLPALSSLEFNFATSRTRSVFALALRNDVLHPFPPESDEVTIQADQEKKEAEGEAKKPGDAKKTDDAKPAAAKSAPVKPAPIKIDFDGLAGRVARLPIPAGNYNSLSAVKDHLLYIRTSTPYYGRDPVSKPALVIFSAKERKETVLAEDAGEYRASHDGLKVIVKQGSAFNLYDANAKGASTKKTISTSNLTVDRVPSQEWTQIFHEVWRRYRDFFYVENMHGYDWEALRRQYAPLLEYVGHRSDLNYVIGEMISELNVGHAYIDGGDFNKPPRPKVALPGARFELDQAAGRYKIASIFAGHNQENEYQSPLTEVGVNVEAGEYVLAIDGEDLTATTNPYRLLRGKAGRPVRLTVNTKPDHAGSREVTFQPIENETNLIYLAMVERNRAMVDKLSQGRVGYLHLPNMSADGLREFVKWFYPQIRKEGLVIDVRSNGGGNVSQMLIDRLDKELLGTRFSRTSETPATYPATVFYGPMACILNETSASDGDIFPAMFRRAKLGPLIGKRSWGGVIGITNRGTLIDGGTVNVPEFGTNAVDGSWIIEGHGVDPDIEVANDPKSVIEGRDPQLERAVAEVMKQMKANPQKLPARPPDPVKTKQAPASAAGGR